MRLLVIFVAAAAVLSAACSPAAAGFSRGGSFTAPGYGARAWGMGGAAVAWGSDEGATYWNPALLSLLDEGRLGFSYVNLVADATARHSYLAYARALKRGTADDPDLVFNEHAFGALYGNLLLELSDGRKYTENSLLIGYSYSPEHFVSIGASVNVLLSSGDIGDFDAKGTAVNLGARALLLEHLTLGVVCRNMFSRVMFDTGEDYALQRTLTLGLACSIPPNATIEGDVVGAYGGIARVVLGGEATFFSDVLSLRGGMSGVTTGDNRILPHMGIGVHLSRIRLDYNANFDTAEAFGNTHRFSLSIGL